jgi:hypothetical protein
MYTRISADVHRFDDLLAQIGVCVSEGEVACSGEIVAESSQSTDEEKRN